MRCALSYIVIIADNCGSSNVQERCDGSKEN